MVLYICFQIFVIMKKYISIICLVLLSGFGYAQIKTPPASPTFELKGTVGFAEVKVVYSRPSANGRVVAGNLIPYNEVWRTGANASTKISFSEEVKLDGHAVPAGEYALYTIFTEDVATIIKRRADERLERQRLDYANTYGVDGIASLKIPE